MKNADVASTRGHLKSKLLWGLLALGLGAGVGAYAMVDIVGDRVYRTQIVNEARSIADMAESMGVWASAYEGVWIKDEGLSRNGVDVGARIDTLRYRSEIEASKELFDIYHRKNPALVQRELADVIQKSESRGKFRLTSDKYMNPMNAPDGFDTRAIQLLRENGQPEYFEISGGELRYARKVVAKESCMSCHDTPEKAPATIRMMYPGPQGYGYVKDGVAGILSVRVPYVYDRSIVLNSF